MRIAATVPVALLSGMLALPFAAAAEEPSLKEGFDEIGRAIKNDTKQGWDATKDVTRKGWDATKRGTGTALEKTGEGVDKAGRAVTDAGADVKE